MITHPTTGVRYSIFSSPGKNLLKSYLKTYKSGGSVSADNDEVHPIVRDWNSKMDAKSPEFKNLKNQINSIVYPQAFKNKGLTDDGKCVSKELEKIKNALIKKASEASSGYSIDDEVEVRINPYEIRNPTDKKSWCCRGKVLKVNNDNTYEVEVRIRDFIDINNIKKSIKTVKEEDLRYASFGILIKKIELGLESLKEGEIAAGFPDSECSGLTEEEQARADKEYKEKYSEEAHSRLYNDDDDDDDNFW